jgi:hypothetical protein
MRDDFGRMSCIPGTPDDFFPGRRRGGARVHHVAIVMSWIAMIAGVLVLVVGVITLTTRRVSPPRWRGRVNWRPYGSAQVCFGAFALLDNVPRVAGASADLVFLLSIVAFLPMIAGAVCLTRAKGK